MESRIDKWLYYTRFYKTRALAAKAVAGGHVRVNGTRVKPSTFIKVGDTIDLVRHQLPYRVVAVSMPGRRGPARDASTWYAENEDVASERQAIVDSRKLDRLQMPRTKGRPDRDTRRKLREGRRS